MRLAKILIDGKVAAARVNEGHVYTLKNLSFDHALFGDGPVMQYENGAQRIEDVRFLAPIPASTHRIFGTGLNYRGHYLEGVGKRGQNEIEEPRHPTFFVRLATSVVGPFDPIFLRNDLTSEVDYEAELAVVIGRQGRDIPAEAALSYVAGYTVANDVSARDIQRQHGQWMKGKSLDGTCPIGPWLVTREDITDPSDLLVECLVNGELRQHEETSAMIHTVPQLIHQLSRGVTLLPGDVLLTGTPEGTGWVREPPEFLSEGDEVVTRVSRIGELRNRVRTIEQGSHLPYVHGAVLSAVDRFEGTAS